MPLTRQKHKNSSRPPGAGISSASYFQSTSTPKGFHPPSYYAAAAGLTHPHPDDDRSAEAEIRHATMADRPFAEPNDSFVPASVPTTQLPTSSSASSTEPSLVSRMSFLNRRLSKVNGMNSKSSSKRKSQLADLPLVEAQLVPSLRDTIDRMTNSPSSPAQHPIMFPHAPLQQNPHDPLPSSSRHQPYPSTPPARPHPQMSPTKTASTPPTSLSRFPNVLESSRIPTPVAVAKAKPNLKPALKTTATSTSMWCSGQGSPTKASPSRSLRSVKGIIGRKMPQIPAEPVPSDITGVQTGNVSTPSIVYVTVAQAACR
ncbi:hypothetical protein DFH94DRAFT_110708 [Russula ochroleuca]|jgi:hypothetical protein|uniref:Uncharacterized protein n=1 Tax=Russula ochroleuca TaxID=152965 RepID=A0A9P5MRY9_9AGAM|nr:hypothetical protein DFH94DRAFT_110708 [Russula ochroleuca]